MAGPAWTNQAVSLIILDELTSGFSGIFGYSPDTSGALVFSIAEAGGPLHFDPYGNQYVDGIVAYDGQDFSQLDGTGLRLQSMVPHVWGSLTYTGVSVKWARGLVPLVADDINAPDPNILNDVNPESWHPYTLANGWTNTPGSFAAKYRLLSSPPQTVEVIGDITAGTIANGTIVANAPAGSGYAPVSAAQPIYTVTLGSTGTVTVTPRVNVSVTGSLNVQAIPAGTTSIRFHGFYSLDAT